MVSSIAIAVVLAILAILLIGKIAGWNILGGKGKTEESTDVITTEGSNDTTAQETVPMVNVVGLYKTAAEEQMKKNGFTNYTFVEKTDATVEKGYVISQSIDDGTSITKDTQITIYVSSGKEKTKVPNVLGYEDSQATTLLEEAGLKVTHGYAYDDNVEKDHVISQSIKPDTEVEEKTIIKLVVSKGNDFEDNSEATSDTEETTEITTEDTPTTAQETTTEEETTEEPEPDDEPTKAIVPDLSGCSEDSAISMLYDAGLSVGSIEYRSDPNSYDGAVLSQGVSAYSEVDYGTSVSLIICNNEKDESGNYICPEY